MSVGGSLNRNM